MYYYYFALIIKILELMHYSWSVFRQESKEKEEIGADNYAILERIRVNQREEHLRVCDVISACASLLDMSFTLVSILAEILHSRMLERRGEEGTVIPILPSQKWPFLLFFKLCKIKFC